jgi:hypothetical protein
VESGAAAGKLAAVMARHPQASTSATVRAALDEVPLPDGEFAWGVVPADLRDRVGEVVAACDRCCDGLFGAEYRTACRRLLARAMPNLHGLLRGTGKHEAIAAAVCWVIASGNERFGRRPGDPCR